MARIESTQLCHAVCQAAQLSNATDRGCMGLRDIYSGFRSQLLRAPYIGRLPWLLCFERAQLPLLSLIITRMLLSCTVRSSLFG